MNPTTASEMEHGHAVVCDLMRYYVDCIINPTGQAHRVSSSDSSCLTVFFLCTISPDSAVVAAANVLLCPEMFVALSRNGMLSPDGGRRDHNQVDGT